MKDKRLLQNQIEQARTKLDQAIENEKEIKTFYSLSVQLDKLIEEYIDLCEQEEA